MGREFDNNTDIILKSWEDDYNILARPKATFDESTNISRAMTMSVDRSGKDQNIDRENFQTDKYNRDTRMDTERGLLTQKTKRGEQDPSN